MIGTLRRECLDHVIIFNERQLHRILTEFLDYYHPVRPHKGLDDDSPEGREVEDDVRKKLWRSLCSAVCNTTTHGKRRRRTSHLASGREPIGNRCGSNWAPASGSPEASGGGIPSTSEPALNPITMVVRPNTRPAATEFSTPTTAIAQMIAAAPLVSDGLPPLGVPDPKSRCAAVEFILHFVNHVARLRQSRRTDTRTGGPMSDHARTPDEH